MRWVRPPVPKLKRQIVRQPHNIYRNAATGDRIPPILSRQDSLSISSMLAVISSIIIMPNRNGHHAIALFKHFHHQSIQAGKTLMGYLPDKRGGFVYGFGPHLGCCGGYYRYCI